MLHNKFWQAFFALTPIIIGILSIIYYIYFVIDLVTDIEAAEATGNASASMILGNIAWFMTFVAFVALICLGSLVFYIVHAVQNPNLMGNNMLIVWILLFFFFSGIGQLIYWIVEIVGKRDTLPTSA